MYIAVLPMFDSTEFLRSCPWIEELENGTEMMIAWATQGRQQLMSGIVDIGDKFDGFDDKLESVVYDIDRKFEERLRPLHDVLTTKVAVSKGKSGEIVYDNWISSEIANCWNTETTKTQPHSGDFIHTHYDTKQRVIVDVKNYTKNVPTSEIDKLWRDMETQCISLGLIVSMTSGIAKHRKGIDIEFRTIQGKPATMILISEAFTHKEYVFVALEILRIHNPTTQFDMVDILRPLQDILGIVSECETNTTKLENDITRVITTYRSTTHIQYTAIQRILRGLFETVQN